MQIHYNFENTDKIKNAVVTTGSFDGVHIGHRFIINHLNQLAKDINGVSVLITFWPHPRKVLFPHSNGKELQLINTQREKIELLKQTALDHLIIATFTPEFAKISSEEFVRELLLEKLHAKIIVVGFNHHFGHNREGSYESLQKLSTECNFQVTEIPEQAIQNETVSSTKIRQALNNGNLIKANAYLDSIFFSCSKLLTTNNLSSIFKNSYRFEIEEDVKLLPPEGYYAAYIKNSELTIKVLVVILFNNETNVNNHYKSIYVFKHSTDSSVELQENEYYNIYFHKRLSVDFPQHELDLDINTINSYLEDVYNLIF